jgi:hypothetical protein
MADVRQSGPLVEATAGGAVTAFRAGAVVSGAAVHADNTIAGHKGLLRGVFRSSKSVGETAQLQVLGPMRNTDWTWTAGLPIFVGPAGVLTQTMPAVGWLQQIAIADSATLIYVDPQLPEDRESTIALPFAWGDATPSTVGLVPANKIITRTQLAITAAFNGTAPALQVGFSGSLDALMPTTHNDPAALGIYETTPGVSFGTDKTILLSITPGSGASAGAGLLVVTFQR